MAQSISALTVWDDIEENLLDVLRGISQSQDYNLTMKDVVTWNGEGFPFGRERPCAGVVIGPEDSDDIFGTVMRRCQRDVGIEMWAKMKGSPRRNKPDASRLYQRMIADIEKALYASDSSGNVGHTRGGNAEDTMIISRQPVSSGDAQEVGAYIRLRVIYRHEVGNLYSKL
jgi:hypothetical protein